MLPFTTIIYEFGKLHKDMEDIKVQDNFIESWEPAHKSLAAMLGLQYSPQHCHSLDQSDLDMSILDFSGQLAVISLSKDDDDVEM